MEVDIILSIYMQDSENPNSEIKFFSLEGAISAGGMGFSQSHLLEKHMMLY